MQKKRPGETRPTTLEMASSYSGVLFVSIRLMTEQLRALIWATWCTSDYCVQFGPNRCAVLPNPSLLGLL